MIHTFAFSSKEEQKITARFGADFFAHLVHILPHYLSLWQIDGLTLTLVDYFSVNCVFKGNSAVYGRVVMKIGKPSKETYSEFKALSDYGGRGFCRAYAADLDQGVILLECIEPGTRLRNEPDLIKRLEVFSSLYANLHRQPNNPEAYPTYLGWVSRINAYMQGRGDHLELAAFMARAEAICRSLGDSYQRSMLLHGDLHHDNILLGAQGHYCIIDPKGVMGDPIWDLPRFILNEYDPLEPYQKRLDHLQAIFHWLSDHLQVPYKVVSACYFVEASMAVCWDVEDGARADMECVRMAHSLCD